MANRVDRLGEERRDSIGDIQEMLKRKSDVMEEGGNEKGKEEARDIFRKTKKVGRSPEAKRECREKRQEEGGKREEGEEDIKR